jgi:hypothetical protein
MGRILEALKQAETKRTRPTDTVPAPRPRLPITSKITQDVEAKSSPGEGRSEEIPYIEVGGPRSVLDASPSVLAAPGPPSKKADLPTPPANVAEGPVAPAAGPVLPDPATVTVAFQPFPAQPPPLAPARQRFAAELVTFHRPDHAVTEQYRELLSSLVAQVPAGRPQVLLLTAAFSGGGTTTTLLNLAITAAREGKLRVAVVDADLRRPALGQRLGLPAAPGLREVLTGTTSLQRALQETGQANLLALTAGEMANGGAAQLAGEAMRSVLRHLRSRFDLILVDTLPWDARPDVGQTDAQKPELSELLQLIPQQGSRLRGCILTHR